MRFDKLEFPEEKPDTVKKPTVEPNEQDEQFWLSQADEHRRAGRYEDALRFYSRTLEVEKSIVVAWVGQVQMLVFLGEYSQAELWGRKALEFFSQSSRTSCRTRTGGMPVGRLETSSCP